MKKIFFIIIIFSIAGCHHLAAQYDAQLSNYWATNNYFNPAYAGQSNNLELTALNRMQWIGIKNAPKTMLITGEMPMEFMGRTHGIGAKMFNESIGLFSHTIISAQYAYKKDMWKGKFSAGIQLGYISEKFKGSQVEIPEDDYHEPSDDGIPNSDIEGTSIDAALGIFYSNKKWYAGISVNHLLAPKLQLGENYILDIPRSYYLTAGYNIQLNNPLLELRPTLLIKSTESSSYFIEEDSLVEVTEKNAMKAMWTNTQIDVNLRLIYNKQYWGGLGWRKGDAAIIMLGGKFKMIEVGYAYDFPISTMIKGTSGSHELFVKYIVDLSLRKKTKNKHKSVRIL